MRLSIINGPNLNLLGSRDPEVYGLETLESLESRIRGWADKLDLETDFFQSNDEGTLVDAIQRASDGIVINPGAFTHTSRAIADAVAAVDVPVVEVHISNIKGRETWRAFSVLDGVANRTIFGRGVIGYRDALRVMRNLEVPGRPIRYGPHAENTADLRIPKEPRGLVTLVHGGFWLQEWARDSMETLATDLYRRGYASLNVEYRRSNAGGSWPGSGHDVMLAQTFISQIPEVRGLSTAVIGHSAGGYLALWLSSRVEASVTVGLAPISDLEALSIFEGPGRFPALDMLGRGAPNKLTPSGRVLLMHGSDDRMVPVSQSTRVDSAMVDIVDDIGHFELLDSSRAHWTRVVETLDSTMR
jgi:3-dehydroquinate dehydratase-2